MGVRERIPAGLAVALAALCCLTGPAAAGNFSIAHDRFVKDGKDVQLISGAIHYFRVIPAQWEDRLLRLKAMGLNTIETYVAWNMHEPYPGDYRWDGWQDLEGFLKLAQKIGFMVILRPGPYICAEWDFGGFPWWLGSKQVLGGGTMKIRTNDADYLYHVDRWWGQLLPRMTPLLYSNGGPIIMVQIENEFGFVGPDEQYLRHLHTLAKDNLVDDVVLFSTDPPSVIDKGSLGGSYSFATVDFGAGWWPISQAFNIAKARNLPGKSPAFVSEFYTGWLSWNGDPFPNTSYAKFIDYFNQVLQYNQGSGSVNLYMAHGGTNFGWMTGAQRNDAKQQGIEWYEGQRSIPSFYDSDITSYDYQAPISEAGDYGQPGSGGPNKFEGIRAAIVAHTNVTLPDAPPRPRIVAYGNVALTQQGTLLDHISDLFIGKGIYSQVPMPMEDYGEGGGLILYRTTVNATWLKAGATLYVGGHVGDHAHILVEGQRVGNLDRNSALSTVLSEVADKIARANDNKNVTMDIIVENVGRVNTGVEFDLKGLTDPLVLLNMEQLPGWKAFSLPLTNTDRLMLPTILTTDQLAPSPEMLPPEYSEQLLGWRVFPLPLQNTDMLQLPIILTTDQPAASPEMPPSAAPAPGTAAASLGAPVAAPDASTVAKQRTELSRAVRMGSEDSPVTAAVFAVESNSSCQSAPSGNGTSIKAPNTQVDGPSFYRGYFSISDQVKPDAKGHYPDTYMSIGGSKWSKGVAFVNGFNLGWYWPYLGPANTLYVPGPLLNACNNEILLLEVGTQKSSDATATVTFVDMPDFKGPSGNFGGKKDGAIVEGMLQSRLKTGQAPPVDLNYYAESGVMGGHMVAMLADHN